MQTSTMIIPIALLLTVGVPANILAHASDFKGFPDVPKDHWAAQAVNNLARRGILQGYPAKGTKSETAIDMPFRPVNSLVSVWFSR